MLIQPKPIGIGDTIVLYVKRKAIRCTMLPPTQGKNGPEDIQLNFVEQSKLAGIEINHHFTIAEFERTTRIPVKREVWEYFAAKATEPVATAPDPSQPLFNQTRENAAATLANLRPIEEGETFAEGGSIYTLQAINPNSTPDEVLLTYMDKKGNVSMMKTSVLAFARATNRRLELRMQ